MTIAKDNIPGFWAVRVLGTGPKFLAEFYKFESPSFVDDQPSDLGDYAAKKI